MNNNYRIITSLANQEIKDVVSLQNNKGRSIHKRFIAQGIRTIRTFIDAGWSPIALYIVHDHIEKTLKQFSDLKSISNQNIILVTAHIMEKISATTTPTSILAVFSIPEQLTPDNIGSGIVCAQLQDPGNLGTLIRTVAAVGKKTVICIEGADPWQPKVIQASAGTIALVHIYKLSWDNLKEIAQKNNISLCALVVTGGKPPSELNLSKSLLIIGSEAHGLPEPWISQCNQKLTLPMPGKTESLNAAVAGSIALYMA